MDSIEIKIGEVIELVIDSEYEIVHFGVFVALRDFDLTKISKLFKPEKDGSFDSWLVAKGYIASKKTRCIDIGEDSSELELSEVKK